MKFYGNTDIGTVRSQNQDYFVNLGLDDNAVLSVVCDGMGGANAGNIASEMAANTISNYVKTSYNPTMKSLAIEKLLRGAVETANIETFDLACKNPKYNGMGTTVVACLVKDNIAHIAHVGDSRAYLITDGDIKQITKDHSIVQTLLENEQITLEQAQSHPRKNVITRAVGVNTSVEADYNEIETGNGILLLCTDGLSGFLSAEQLRKITQGSDIAVVPDILIKKAIENKSSDNITVTVIKGNG